MTRSDEPLFDPRIADWLEDDPYAAPDQALDVVLAAFPSIKQRRALRVPWRVPGMNAPLRVGLTAAAVGALAIGSLLVFNRGSGGPAGPGGPASATPAPTASSSSAPSPSPSTALLDTSSWRTYESARYGFSIGHPTDWTENPAQRDWTLEPDAADWLSPAQESFVAAAGDVRLSAWSVAVEPGTSAQAWIQTYCEAAAVGQDCSGFQDGAIPISTGGSEQHPGVLITNLGFDHPAFILNGDRMYVLVVWRDESDPSVMPYGGARRLLESFLSTMVLSAPEATSPPPS
jgi:hypothetical protein